MPELERSAPPPVLAFTQGDPAGIGPEILLKLVADPDPGAPYCPLLIAERAALRALGDGGTPEERFAYFDSPPSRRELQRFHSRQGLVAVLDPVGLDRTVTPGEPQAADAGGAVAALDAGIDLARRGVADALITAPIGKEVISRLHQPGFRGHTDYLAAACGLERYGRDYLMTFLTPDLQVALLSTHVPLRDAVQGVDPEAVLSALQCLDRHAGGRIAVAGLNPHAGEEGLLGHEDRQLLAPAVRQASEAGIDVRGPESADSIFARARHGEFDWVLALYHDQGLIAVKTAWFGHATNWTLGLPFLRTSVDHGTAYAIAGQGRAEVEPLRHVVTTTLKLLDGDLPRGRRAGSL